MAEVRVGDVGLVQVSTIHPSSAVSQMISKGSGLIVLVGGGTLGLLTLCKLWDDRASFVG